MGDLLFLEVNFFDFKRFIFGGVFVIFLLVVVFLDGMFVLIGFLVILDRSLFFELFCCSSLGVFGLLFVFFLRNFCFVVFVFKCVREVLFFFLFFIVNGFFCILFVFIKCIFFMFLGYLGDMELELV